jgi:hypothetical protein
MVALRALPTEGDIAVKKTKRGQKPGTMHIDRRAHFLLKAEMAEGPDDEMLSTRELADWLCCSTQFLEIARSKGTGPKFTMLSPKVIRYTRGHVRDWLHKRSHMRTGDYSRKRKRGVV